MSKPEKPGDRMLAALALPGLTYAERVVAAVIAWHDGDDGAYPAIKTIADKVGMSRSRLFVTLRSLEANGVLARVRRQRTSRYVLDYSSAPRLSQMSRKVGHQKSGTSDVLKSGTSDVPETDTQMSRFPGHKQEENRNLREGEGNHPSQPSLQREGLPPLEDSQEEEEPSFYDVPNNRRQAARRAWRQARGRCGSCGDPATVEELAGAAMKNCKACRMKRASERWRQNGRCGGCGEPIPAGDRMTQTECAVCRDRPAGQDRPYLH